MVRLGILVQYSLAASLLPSMRQDHKKIKKPSRNKTYSLNERPDQTFLPARKSRYGNSLTRDCKEKINRFAFKRASLLDRSLKRKIILLEVFA